ncbi:MAG: hypothetical protein Q7W30_05540 [Coriobacteriia bacterium]|nr:hypothetical protein [Coriobacteriia bacterium]
MPKAARIFVITISILNALAGLICGALFLISPDGSLMGFQPLLPVVGTLPLADVFFRDLTWIGIAMLLALGIPNAVATVMLLRRVSGQYAVTLVAGVLLILWTGFELIFMFNVAAVAYSVVGVLSIVCSAMLLRQTVPAGA